ncbi:TetR family transcriptional regulator [Protofrankia coriariae]|uniref:Transcriptional regulator n=1 Tax=Protofrankia coriariae TaxID=1562887 RepID=A0ABR5F6V6_9ACTN|nr:TetR family transcriptional regulator [Protofrankia coriariae]KLL12459.1 transcriptional regulator [Protofrankia coriariae]
MTTVRTHPGKKATATRQRILDAAAKIFRQNGYTGTRLTDIAAAAQMQAGSLYYHFASREDLVQEVLRVGQQRTNDFVIGKVSAAPPTTSSLDRLRIAVHAHLEAVLEIGDYTAATLRILGQVPEEIRAQALTLQREYGQWWRELFENAQREGELRQDLDISACRMLVLGAMNASPDWFHPDQPKGLTLSGLEEQFAALFLDGLGTSKGKRRRSHKIIFTLTSDTHEEPAAETRGAATTARILDAAAKIFRENGYAGARLVDVATEADMQTGSLYYHFASREDLVVHLLHNAWERTDSAVRRSISDLLTRTAPINKLAMAMTAHLLSVLAWGDYTSAMLRILGQVPDDVRAAILPLQRTYLDLWRGLLNDAADAGDIRSDLDLSVVLMMLAGALNWTVEWYHADHHLAPEQLAEQFCVLTLEGMSTRRRSTRRRST